MLDHHGDDPTRGWRVYLAYPADARPVLRGRRRSAAPTASPTATAPSSTSPSSPADRACPIVEQPRTLSIGLGRPTRCRADYADDCRRNILASRMALECGEEAGAELLAVRLELGAVQRQAADDVGAGGLHGAGELSRLLPGSRANVQNTAARLPRIAGRLEIVAAAHGVWPTTNSPCTHVPTSTMSASWIAAWSGWPTVPATVIVQPSWPSPSAISSAAFQVFPVRLSTSRAARIAATVGDARRSALALQRCPGQSEVLDADAGEVDRRLGVAAALTDVDDDALAERRVLDVVADAQTEGVGVARLGSGALAGGDGRLDDAVAVGVAAIAGSPVVAARRRAIRRRSAEVTGEVPAAQALAAVRACGRRRCPGRRRARRGSPRGTATVGCRRSCRTGSGSRRG